MDFSLTKMQETLVQKATSMAKCFEAAPNQAGFCGGTAWSKCAESGWAGLCLSAPHGGGHGALDSVLAFEALGRGGADRGALFATGAHLFGCAKAVELFASDDQREHWLPQLANGLSVGALALTEAAGGSELNCARTSLTERPNSDHLVLDGEKIYITNGANADVFVVLAHEPGAHPPLNLTAVLVHSDSVSVSAAPMASGQGLIGSGMARVMFDACDIHPNQILGRRRGGFGVALSMMQWERTCILAGALGALFHDFERVTSALTARRDSKGPLVMHQAVSHKLANIRQKIEMARLMMLRAAWELDHHGDQVLYPSLSKLTVSETVLQCTTELHTLMGAAGWEDAFGLGQAVQDALAMISASGTAEIQRNLIAKRLVRT